MAPPPRFHSKRTLAPQRAPGIYHSTYDPAVAAAICRRLAAGESLRSICRADPAMPTEKTVWNWARAHEAFRMMKAHALSVARARSLAEQAARDAARWDGVGFGDGRSWRGGTRDYGPKVGDEILARLMCGEGLVAICRDPAMPSVGTVYNWLRRDPEFVERYRWAKSRTQDIMVVDACEKLAWLGERKSGPMLNRTVKAAEKAARRLSLKRYAPAAGPRNMTVAVEEADGTVRVIYPR